MRTLGTGFGAGPSARLCNRLRRAPGRVECGGCAYLRLCRASYCLGESFGSVISDRAGLQGGTIPVKLGPKAVTDPYGHANDEYQAEPEFADYLCAAMAQTMSRFEGCRPNFRERRNGGIGAFTPDNVPVFDWVLPNVYTIADSNHGFKMTGVGKLVSKKLMGDHVNELEPFALSRFAKGKTFGASNSHSPWV